MKNWLIIFIFLFSQLTFAQCPEEVFDIRKGEVAPCNGLLFSPQASKEVLEAQNNVEYYKNIADKLIKRKELSDKQVEVLDKRLNGYIDQSHLLATQLYKKEKEDKWQKMIYFGLGVLATGIAVSGAAQLGR